MLAMIQDSMFRLWNCLFWIKNRKIKHLDKSLVQTRDEYAKEQKFKNIIITKSAYFIAFFNSFALLVVSSICTRELNASLYSLLEHRNLQKIPRQ